MEGHALLWLVILTTVVASQSSGHNESDTHHRWRPSMNLDDLRQLILEGDVSGFENEARSFREDQPNLADLSAMANDVFRGLVPQYLRDNNYAILPSMKGGSSGGNGLPQFYQENVAYFTIHTEGDRGTASMFDFYNVSIRTDQSRPYVTGNGYHTFARYTKENGSIEFELSTLGALLYKLPSGVFILTGNYTGVSQGSSVQTTEEMAQASAYTLGSINTGTYASRKIMQQNGIYSHHNMEKHVNSFSVTGGTNSTLDMYTFSSPDLNNTFWMNINGTLRNHDKESVLNATFQASHLENTSYLTSEKFMVPIIFMSRFGSNIYLT